MNNPFRKSWDRGKPKQTAKEVKCFFHRCGNYTQIIRSLELINLWLIDEIAKKICFWRYESRYIWQGWYQYCFICWLNYLLLIKDFYRWILLSLLAQSIPFLKSWFNKPRWNLLQVLALIALKFSLNLVSLFDFTKEGFPSKSNNAGRKP